MICNINIKPWKYYKIWLNLFALIMLYITSANIIIAHNTFPTIYETYDTFHPQAGSHGAVATQEAEATKVGIEILKNGGNAVDAAVAIGYALAVTLPRAGNIGGGGFMTIWLNKEQKAYVINYRERAPSTAIVKQLKDIPHQEFIHSYKAAGVPGTVAGLNLANKKFGKLKLATLIKPAIKLAKDGFVISHEFTQALNYSKDILLQNVKAKKIFFNYNKQTPNNILKQTELAKTLLAIARHGDQGFYSGQTADFIVKAMHDNGGFITKQDLTNYAAEIVEPIITTYRDYKIITPPPPAGGAILSEILNILEALNIDKINNNSAQYFHYLTESFNLAYRDRNYNLGDPKFVDNNLTKLISKNYARDLAKTIDTSHHTNSSILDQNKIQWHEGPNTTHYVVIDKDLNVVSNTYTLNLSFGCGKIIPGAGFFMNNELDDFTIDLGHTNSFGLQQGEKNLIKPNKQPISSMVPTIILTKDNQPFLATGSPGGSKITTTVAQIILNVIDHNLNISSAVAMPRIHSQLLPDVLYYESGVSPDTIEKLNAMGHVTQQSLAMGSAQSLAYNKKTMQATVDYRRSGSLASVY